MSFRVSRADLGWIFCSSSSFAPKPSVPEKLSAFLTFLKSIILYLIHLKFFKYAFKDRSFLQVLRIVQVPEKHYQLLGSHRPCCDTHSVEARFYKLHSLRQLIPIMVKSLLASGFLVLLVLFFWKESI